MASLKLVFTCLCFLASFSFSFQMNLTDIFKDSPCKPSPKLVEAYQECTRHIYKKDKLTTEDVNKQNAVAKLTPCAWNKLGVFVDSTGFNPVAFGNMVEEMPIDETVKTRLSNTASQCLKSHTGKQIMKCVINEKRKVCNF